MRCPGNSDPYEFLVWCPRGLARTLTPSPGSWVGGRNADQADGQTARLVAALEAIHAAIPEADHNGLAPEALRDGLARDARLGVGDQLPPPRGAPETRSASSGRATERATAALTSTPWIPTHSRICGPGTGGLGA